jgi:hypothetical protein
MKNVPANTQNAGFDAASRNTVKAHVKAGGGAPIATFAAVGASP